MVEFASLYSLHLPKSTWQRSCLYSILCTYTRFTTKSTWQRSCPVSIAFCTYARSSLSPHGRGPITVQRSLYLYKITESTWQRSCSYSTLCTGLYKIMESTWQRSCSYSILCTSTRVHMAEVLSLSMLSLPSIDYSSAPSPRSFNFMCAGILEMLQVFREPMSTLPSPQQRPL